MTMTEDRSNALIVHSVVDLGHNLGLTIVAEGVETEQALTELRGFGCDIVQGYHLSRPITADALTTWLHGRNIRPLRADDHTHVETASARAGRRAEPETPRTGPDPQVTTDRRPSVWAR